LVRSPAQLGDIVAQHLSETAWFEKVALHIDDEQGAGVGHKLERIRFRFDRDEGLDFMRCVRSSFSYLPCGGRWSWDRGGRVVS